MTRVQALVDLLLALLLPVLGGLVAAEATLALVGGLSLPLLLLIQGLVTLGGIGLLLWWRGHSWDRLALRPIRLKDLWLGLVALVGVFVLNIAFTLSMRWLLPDVIAAHQERMAGLSVTLTEGLRLGAVAVTMLFVGFYEEVTARGFFLDRSRVLLGGVWGPVLLSSTLFGFGHFYQGWLGVVQTALVGVVFARLVLRWGTLWPVILAHAALNFLSLSFLRELGGPASGAG